MYRINLMQIALDHEIFSVASDGGYDKSATAPRYTPGLCHAQIFSSIKKGTTMPRPARNRQPKPRPRLPQDVATAAEMRGLTPLGYMLAVMRNPKSSQRRRDRMAVVCARYLHSRPADPASAKSTEPLEARQAGRRRRMGRRPRRQLVAVTRHGRAGSARAERCNLDRSARGSRAAVVGADGSRRVSGYNPCRRPGGRIDRHDQRGGEDRVCARHTRDVVQDGAGRRRLERAGRYASRLCGGTSKGKSQPVDCSSTPR